MPDKEEATELPVVDSPDPSSDNTEPTGSDVVSEETPGYVVPDNFEELMREELAGDIIASEPDAVGEGTEVPAEDAETPGDAEEAGTAVEYAFSETVKVRGEEFNVNLSEAELKATVQKGLDWDKKDEFHQTEIEDARQEERDKAAETQPSKERTEQIEKAENLSAVVNYLYSRDVNFKEMYDEAMRDNMSEIQSHMTRMKGQQTEGEAKLTETQKMRAELDELKADRTREKEDSASMKQFSDQVMAFREQHPKLSRNRIIEVAKFAFARGYPLGDAWLMLKGKGGNKTVEAEAKKIAANVAANKKVVNIPAGSSTAPGGVATVPLGSPADQAREAAIARIRNTYGNDMSGAINDEFLSKIE